MGSRFVAVFSACLLMLNSCGLETVMDDNTVTDFEKEKKVTAIS